MNNNKSYIVHGSIAYKQQWLTEASYDMSLNEQKLMLACVGKINPEADVPDEITISTSEFANLFPELASNVKRDLKKAADKLWDRTILIKEDNVTRKYRWVQESAEYHTGECRVTIKFSDAVKKYLSHFSGSFAKIALENVKGLKSGHSIRLYELCRQYMGSGIRVISIEDFRFTMGLGTKYPDFRDLNKRVIQLAVDEINKKTTMKLKVNRIKKNGRSYTHLDFIFSDDGQMNLAIE